MCFELSLDRARERLLDYLYLGKEYLCGKCDYSFIIDSDAEMPKYCPRCGNQSVMLDADAEIEILRW